jgi:signal peptidase I
MSPEKAQDERTRTRVAYDEAEEVPKSWLRRQLDEANTLLVAVLIALALRAFVIEPFRIPSGSMLPTLLVGDHLFVNKFVYGIKVPFTGIRLPKLRDPQRGDVVVFTVAREQTSIYPADRRPELGREEFVKRIVGLPGDTIEVSQGILRVNGEEVRAEDQGTSFTDDSGHRLRVAREAIGSHEHVVLDDPLLSGLTQAKITVEPGRYFMMGDNRDHSNDSRAWGTVRLQEFKGPAFILYWSWNYEGGWAQLLNPLTWIRLLRHETRWDRIGDRVV